MASSPIQIRIYKILEKGGAHTSRASRICDIILGSLIILNLIAISLESVSSINAAYSKEFFVFEIFSVFIFGIEYCLRIWCAPARDDMPGAGPLKKRMAYIFSGHGLIDLLAILPSIAALVMTSIDLRWLRVMRMLRLFKISHYSTALEDLFSAIRDERGTFAAAFYLFTIAFFIASTLIYLIENEVQPEVFSSIPHAMWWSIITLTTVGYGDVSPITIAGKFVGAATAMMGVLTVALLTGIVATAFSNQMARRKEIFKAEVAHALEDGEVTATEEEHLEDLRKRYDISEEHAKAILELAKEHRKPE